MPSSSPDTRHFCAGCHKEFLPGDPAGSREPLDLNGSSSATCAGASEGGSYAWNGRCGHADARGVDGPKQSADSLWRSAAARGTAALKLLGRTVVRLIRRRAGTGH
jgi:hypothetical protein